uniref:Uncharacterized protein n=1 Tax=Oryza sativa subsp. japonica TaxID=39947 RepID=Q10KT7_ORYSJ|nr:hypothetical protein LOC_Os03g25464 [Oryza sativa Japonica Group]
MATDNVVAIDAFLSDTPHVSTSQADDCILSSMSRISIPAQTKVKGIDRSSVAIVTIICAVECISDVTGQKFSPWI